MWIKRSEYDLLIKKISQFAQRDMQRSIEHLDKLAMRDYIFSQVKADCERKDVIISELRATIELQKETKPKKSKLPEDTTIITVTANDKDGNISINVESRLKNKGFFLGILEYAKNSIINDLSPKTKEV